MNDKEGIKIGRINRVVEKALGISLPSDVVILIEEKDLSNLAFKHPSTYLKEIEEVGRIIKTPHYVRFDEKKEKMLFVREYLKKGEFRKIGVEIAHLGTPKRWIFQSMRGYSPDELKSLDLSIPFHLIG